MTYVSTKTWGHDVGLSCCFRQWRSTHSHCQYLHGYAISVHLEFEAATLDGRNWVVDFGGLKDLKRELEATFDHKTVISQDDPHLEWFKQGNELGVLDLVVVEAVGCERFAEMVWLMGSQWLVKRGLFARVRLSMVEVREHGANSAIYRP